MEKVIGLKLFQKHLTGKVNKMTKLYKAHHKRLKIILFFTLSFISINAFKTIYIQVFKTEDKQIDTQIQKKGDRGIIYDRNNQKLAYDIDVYDIYVEGLSDYEVNRIFNPYDLTLIKTKDNKYLIESVSYHIIEMLDEIFKNNPKITKSIKYKGRYYPEKGLASQLIGRFSDKNDTIGRWGIERIMNQKLKAQSGFLEYLVTPRGSKQKNYSNNEYLELSGQDIKLTIDIEYQRILEQELMSQLKITNSKSANGIIVNPYNGEILALASVPTADLNKKLPNIEFIKDYVCGFSYEPGSTLKPFSVLAGISNGSIELSHKYYCENGKYKVPKLNRKPVVDHDPYDTLSVKEILAHSSNIGLVKISSDIGRQDIYNTFKSVGFGQDTGIDSYSESSGLLIDLDKWDDHSLVTIPIGQGRVSVTNLQVAMAYSAIANGGYLLKPRIIIESDNKNEPEVIREIASSANIELLVESLKMVVTDGTAASIMKNNEICSYGKTGTAQVWMQAEKFEDKNSNNKWDEGESYTDENQNNTYDEAQYSKTDFISSYAGVFPCDKPELVCVISFIYPDKDKKWASQSAVPAFNEILNRVLNEDINLSFKIENEVR